MLFRQFKIGRKCIDNVFFAVSFCNQTKIPNIRKNVCAFNFQGSHIQVNLSCIQPSSRFSRTIFINDTRNAIDEIDLHIHFEFRSFRICWRIRLEIIYISNKIANTVAFISNHSDHGINNCGLIKFNISRIKSQRKPIRIHAQFSGFYKFVIFIIFDSQAFDFHITKKINLHIFHRHSHFEVVVQKFDGLVRDVTFGNRQIDGYEKQNYQA